MTQLKNKTAKTQRREEKANILCVLCVFAVFFFLCPVRFFAQTLTQNLAASWQFTESGKNEWLPATVPGTVHTDLLANGKIPDPYFGDNEAKVQWVETKTWEYKTVFDCDKKLWKQKTKRLIFDGLDTYADVYLNDSLLFTAENMFLPYGKDVTKLLRKKKNVLRVVFHPASELIEKNISLAEVKNLPGGDRVFIRKAQYQFGWDWGPRLVTCGMWKPVRLEGWSGFDVDYVHFKTDAIEEDTACLVMDFMLKEAIAKGQSIHIRISENGVTYTDETLRSFPPPAMGTGILVKIPHPRLWWCNGMGKPNLYEFTCEFTCGKKKSVRKVRCGIRKLQMNADVFAFSFILNDRPVFIKGANWIPCDNFLPRVTTEKYYALLKNAQQSNMNMLRVWGGGVYEDERFYSMCDSLGLFVWQDFMFAGGMYPGNLRFRESVYRECANEFFRLSAHPCIAIWCGNNEIDEGWHNWGWQKEFALHGKDSTIVWNDYLFLFDTQMKDIIRSGDRYAMYWPSSPSTGWGRNEAYIKGDVHYWGVWWGMEPFSTYETHVGRFVSEYGFQALPDERTFFRFTGKEDLSLSDPFVRAHQKHPTGFQTINTYMLRDYPVPGAFDDYIYVSQVMQLDGMSRAIEAHRRARPYCMGTLLWQYNDCWPVTSWSTTDYFGRPKLLQHALKDLYAPVLVSVMERNDSVFIYLVNDDTIAHKGLLGFRWLSFDGLPIRSSMTPTAISAGWSESMISFSKQILMDTLAPERGVLQVVFNYENNQVVKTQHYFVPVKTLMLPKDPGISFDVSPQKDANGNYAVTLRTILLAKNVFLTLDDPAATFSANGFDMLPGDERTVLVKTELTGEELRKKLAVKTMNSLQ